ncbi:MAG: transcriptional repressor LexA [Candidatus Schekmanbacteria bacterium]|nr:transcriptional repressor LexA [Candidatus Schekmanbacteria bacterium]
MLTKRQAEVLRFIESFVTARGYSPSLEEIRDNLGLSSVATVHKHVANLIEKGYVKRLPHRGRSLEMPESPGARPEAIELPLLGVIAAGAPIEAVAGHELFEVPASLVPRAKRCYCLRVQGDSMIGDHICDGDVVIIEDRAEARNGETVVALVRGREATLKRLFRLGEAVSLVAANPHVPTLVLAADDVRVQGVVVGLVRHFS